MRIKTSYQLFVDATGWLAFLDKKDPYHEQIVRIIFDEQVKVFTSDQELLFLTYLQQSDVDERALAELVKLLLSNRIGHIIKVTEEEKILGWRIFCHKTDCSPTFPECVSFHVIVRRGIKTFLSSRRWMSTELNARGISPALENIRLN